MQVATAIIIASLLRSVLPAGEAPAPVAGAYGNAALKRAIFRALRSNDDAAIAAAIRAAQAARGAWLGCPTELAPASATVATVAPDPAAVMAHWRTSHAPAFAQLDLTPPRIARDAAAPAWGGLMARLAGGNVDTARLTEIAENLIAQQYCDGTVSGDLPLTPGAFGYLFVPVNDPWYRGGAVSTQVAQVHAVLPHLFATYDRGAYAGRSFLVADSDAANGFADGGLAYDTGWGGMMLIEAAIQLEPAAVRDRCRNAALAAGSWAMAEPCVVNHNYTAKLVWLLAGLYAWTGDIAWRDACLAKFDRCIAPGILMDADRDGHVDAVPAISFAALAASARTPGRMWDGHNALPWYHAIVATSVVETYVALRDRGDAAAARIRPFALAMVDNLAVEQGGIATVHTSNVGFADVPIPLLIAKWKIAKPEGLEVPTWDRACAALWHAGKDLPAGRWTIAAGLYAAVYCSAPYHAPERRDPTHR